MRGKHWEQSAERFLWSRDIPTIATNYRSRHGEIDLVSIDGSTLVFVEVKYRTTSQFGSALLSLRPRQQRRIAQTASVFLTSRPGYTHWHCRFDLIAFDQREDHVQLTWLKAAFNGVD